MAIAATPITVAASAPAIAGNSGDWLELAGRLQLKGPAHQLAAQLKLLEQQGSRWRLALAPNAEMLNTPTARGALEQALRSALGADTSVEILVRNMDGETPAERTQRARGERIAEAEQKLLADPGLQSLTRDFGARIIPGSLRLEEQEGR